MQKRSKVDKNVFSQSYTPCLCGVIGSVGDVVQSVITGLTGCTLNGLTDSIDNHLGRLDILNVDEVILEVLEQVMHTISGLLECVFQIIDLPLTNTIKSLLYNVGDGLLHVVTADKTGNCSHISLEKTVNNLFCIVRDLLNTVVKVVLELFGRVQARYQLLSVVRCLLQIICKVLTDVSYKHPHVDCKLEVFGKFKENAGKLLAKQVNENDITEFQKSTSGPACTTAGSPGDQ